MTEICAGCGRTISLFMSAESVPIGGIIDDKDYCNLCYVKKMLENNYKNNYNDKILKDKS